MEIIKIFVLIIEVIKLIGSRIYTTNKIKNNMVIEYITIKLNY